MAIQIKLAGRPAEPRLPALLQAAARSGTQAQDPFLPSGYLQATGTFDVSATARGGDEAATQQALTTQDTEIVVLELADGSTLITSAARLHDTLARTRPELLGPEGEVLLEKLRTAGAAPGRGIGEAVGGLLSKVYTFVAGGVPDAIVDEALTQVGNRAELGVSWAGTKALMWAIEKRLDRQPGLYRWVGGTGKAERSAAGRPVVGQRCGAAADARVRARHRVEHAGQLRRPAQRRPRPVGRARAPVPRRHLRLRAPHAVAGPDRERHRAGRRAAARRAGEPGLALARRPGGRPAVPGRLRRADRALRLCLCRHRRCRSGRGAARASARCSRRMREQRDQLRALAQLLRDQAGRWCSATCAWPARPTAPSWPAATSTCSCPAC